MKKKDILLLGIGIRISSPNSNWHCNNWFCSLFFLALLCSGIFIHFLSSNSKPKKKKKKKEELYHRVIFVMLNIYGSTLMKRYYECHISFLIPCVLWTFCVSFFFSTNANAILLFVSRVLRSCTNLNNKSMPWQERNCIRMWFDCISFLSVILKGILTGITVIFILLFDFDSPCSV